MNKEYLDLDLLAKIEGRAEKIHKDVNQLYDDLPYGFHLTLVSDYVLEYVDYFNLDIKKIYPIYFAACFHDSIEDARLTYNDVMKIAREYFDKEDSLLATEIVYALTNEKGRTRKERANEKYYEGIRNTPFAPFVKVCDRLANTTYSIKISKSGHRMHDVYKNEFDHFIESLTKGVEAFECTIPQTLIDRLKNITYLENNN